MSLEWAVSSLKFKNSRVCPGSPLSLPCAYASGCKSSAPAPAPCWPAVMLSATVIMDSPSETMNPQETFSSISCLGHATSPQQQKSNEDSA